jgi:hypothetical protein
MDIFFFKLLVLSFAPALLLLAVEDAFPRQSKYFNTYLAAVIFMMLTLYFSCFEMNI